MRVTTILAAAALLALAALLTACGDAGPVAGEPDDLAADTVTDGDQADSDQTGSADDDDVTADEPAAADASDGLDADAPEGLFDDGSEELYTAAVDHLLDDLGGPIRINPSRNGVNGERLAVPFPPETIEALEARDGVTVGGDAPEDATALTLSLPGGDDDERRMRVETPEGFFDLHFERDGDSWRVVGD